MAVADGLPAETSAPSRTLFKVGAAAIVFMCLTIVIVDIYEIPGRQSFFLSIGNRVSTQHYGTKHDALAKPTSNESSELAAARVRCLPPAAWRSLGTLEKLVCLGLISRAWLYLYLHLAQEEITSLKRSTSTESSELAAARVRCLPPAAWRSLGTLAKLVCLGFDLPCLVVLIPAPCTGGNHLAQAVAGCNRLASGCRLEDPLVLSKVFFFLSLLSKIVCTRRSRGYDARYE